MSSSDHIDKSRVGTFYLSINLIEDNPKQITEMFHVLEIVVLRAEMLYHRDSIEYIAYSPFFEQKDQAATPTEYKIEINVNKFGNTEYGFKKLE